MSSVAVPAEATEAMQEPESPRAIEESRARVARAADAAPSAAVVLAAEPCWDAASDDRSFSGSISMSGRTIHEQIGRRGGDRVIQTRLGDVRLCMITEGFRSDREARPSEWIARADRVIERQIADLDVERRVQAIENDIQALDVPGRSRELEQRRDAAAARLRDVLR